jgi:hypothetical protein
MLPPPLPTGRSTGLSSALAGQCHANPYWGYIGSQDLAGTRLYAPVTAAVPQRVCYDVALAAACVSQPYAVAGMGNGNSVPAFSVFADGKLFVTSHKLWCFDAATASGTTVTTARSGPSTRPPARPTCPAASELCPGWGRGPTRVARRRSWAARSYQSNWPGRSNVCRVGRQPPCVSRHAGSS